MMATCILVACLRGYPVLEKEHFGVLEEGVEP
jgi:hypothetical protein